jgi:oligopeptidase A
MQSVANTPELRDAVQSITPARVNFELRFGQSQAIYNALKALKNNPAAWENLRPDQQRLVDITYRDMANSGVGLSEADRQRLGDLVQHLSHLSTEFSNNVLDATAVS